MNRKIVKEIMMETLTGEYFYDEKNNIFYEEIYTDYRDCLDEDTIKNILESDNPGEYFDEIILDGYLESIGYLEHEALEKVIDAIKEKYSDDYNELNEDYDYSIYNFETDDEDDLRDLLYDYFYVKIPYDHYLNQEIKANIIIDAGDGNYEFTLNNCYNDTFEACEESANLWLTRTQGYTREQLEKAVNDMEFNGSKFLSSMYDEVLNCMSSMNALSFFVKATLGELIDFKENKDEIESITVKKNTNCGLADYWCGSGSILGIELEKDVEIPVRFIDSFTIDGGRGSYGIDSIYGMIGSFWNGEYTINKKSLKEKVC